MLGSPPPSLLSKDVVRTENSRTLHDRNMRSDDFPVDLFSLQLDELKLLQDKAPEAKSQVLVARYLTGMFTPFLPGLSGLKVETVNVTQNHVAQRSDRIVLFL